MPPNREAAIRSWFQVDAPGVGNSAARLSETVTILQEGPDRDGEECGTLQTLPLYAHIVKKRH